MLALTTILSALLVARHSYAQVTTTLPWLNGDTIVVSPTTNPINGVVQTVTISTIVTGAGGVGGAGGLATTSVTSTTNTRTRTTTTTTTPAGGAGVQPTTTQPRVVGQETTYPPMMTTTYGYDPGNGVGWISATWTASNTGNPTVVTAIVPAGTILDYNSYQSVVNAAVYSSAVAADAVVQSNGTVTYNSGAGRAQTKWAAVGLAAAGAALGAMMI